MVLIYKYHAQILNLRIHNPSTEQSNQKCIVFLLNKIKNGIQKYKKDNTIKFDDLPIGFYLCVSNVITLVMVMFVNNWNI